MATVGLQGIWPLEQLDRTGIGTWKLGLILAGAAGVVGYVLWTVVSWMEPSSSPLIQPDADNDGKMARVLTFFAVAQMYAYLVLARLIERDLGDLSSIDSHVAVSREKLRCGKGLVIACGSIGLVYGFLLFPVAISLVVPELTFVGTLHAVATGESTAVVCFILAPIYGVTAGIGFAVAICQVSCLVQVSRHIRIDFLLLSEYATVANAGVRLLLAFIPAFSFLLLMLLLADETDTDGIAFLIQILVFGSTIATCIILPYAYPVWILRNRIREEKAGALNQVARAIRGDAAATKALIEQGLGAPTTTAELLTHRMFLESRWEWPIAAHLQKLILFGLLPPLTWVLAAVVENLMY